MSETQTTVPEGFKVLPEGLGFTDVLRPVYRREQGDKLVSGMFVRPQLCNLIGICHGGALMTLADVAAASSINFARNKLAGTPTLSLSFDFINAAREGDWLEAHTDRVSVKNRFGFASGVITRDEKIILRYSGTFYYPDHDGFKSDLESIARLHGQG
jgi:uncharacterized protein (TIGR00369 family)